MFTKPVPGIWLTMILWPHIGRMDLQQAGQDRQLAVGEDAVVQFFRNLQLVLSLREC